MIGALRAAAHGAVDDLLAAVYADVPPDLHPVARYSLWAHLRKLGEEGLARSADGDDITAQWRSA